MSTPEKDLAIGEGNSVVEKSPSTADPLENAGSSMAPGEDAPIVETDTSYTSQIIAVFVNSQHPPEREGEHACWLADLDGGNPRFITVAIRSLYKGLDGRLRPGSLKQLLDQAVGRDGTYREAWNLYSYYMFDCPVAVDPGDLLKALVDSGRVHFAEIVQDVSAPVVAEHVRSKISTGYLEPAPIGIGAAYAWRLPGGDGSGLRFVDVEGGWNLDDPDLVDVGIRLLAGRNGPCGGRSHPCELAHGTAVLGIVAAMNNGRDVTGIAHGLGSVAAVSIYETDKNSTNIPGAILTALADLRFGDVLLVEIQVKRAQETWRPIESSRTLFEAIRLATARGVVVVEPAGNGGYNLDKDKGFGDSGAIIVGASQSEASHLHLSQSNFGQRLDCFAWGENVITLWDYYSGQFVVPKFSFAQITGLKPLSELPEVSGDGTVTRLHEFDGTSCASAIVAGIALVVQSLAHTYLRFRLSPFQLRLLLSDPANGTPSADSCQYPIGVMPDLKKIVEEVFSIPPRVYLRDHVGDIGEGPRETRWQSPDIILTEEAVHDPQELFGEESWTEDRLVRQKVNTHAGCFVYVRMRNRGGEREENVTARVFCSPVASSLFPSRWQEVGSVSVPTVEPGDQLTVSSAISWEGAKVPKNAYCALIALIGSYREAFPRVPETWEDIQALLRSNSFACRNFHHVEHASRVEMQDPDSYVRLAFLSPGFPNEDLVMRLEVDARLSRQARVWLEMTPARADLEGIWMAPPGKLKGRICVPVNPNGRSYFRERLFKARSCGEVKVIAYIPPELRQRAYQISVRQIYGQIEVGRVTWRLVPRS
jgi:serine protease